MMWASLSNVRFERKGKLKRISSGTCSSLGGVRRVLWKQMGFSASGWNFSRIVLVGFIFVSFSHRERRK